MFVVFVDLLADCVLVVVSDFEWHFLLLRLYWGNNDGNNDGLGEWFRFLEAYL